MRIGIDVRASQLRAGRRGLGAYTFALAEGLAAAKPGHEYVLIALPDVALPDRLQALLRPGGPCRVVTQQSPLLRWDSWAARRLKLWRVYFRAHHLARRRELERVARRERLDVLHLPIPVMVHLSFACDARRAGAGCAVVKTLHDTTPIVLGDTYFSTISATRRYTYLEQMSWYRDADAVVAISASARDDGVEHLGLGAERIRVVSPAVTGAFTPATNPHELAAVSARHGIGHPYFLVCSGEGVNKNFPRIIEAFARTTTAPTACSS